MKTILILIIAGILSLNTNNQSKGLIFKIKKDEVKCFGCSAIKSIDYHQYHFLNKVNFAGSTFIDTCNFSMTRFDYTADFAQAIFEHQAQFDNSNYYSDAFFQIAHFKSSAEFLGSNFNNGCSFEATRFDGEAHFGYNNFHKEIIFRDAMFDYYPDFNNSTFDSLTTFARATFNSPADFSQCKFDGEVSFDNTIFNSDVDFSKSSFHGNIKFEKTIFKGRLNLSYVKDIERVLDLTMTADSFLCLINLYNSDISKIKIDYKRFRLDLPDTVSFEYRLSVYQLLLKNFQNDGLADSYELLDKEYQALLYRHNHEEIKGFVAKWWWDYGYSKERIFLWSLVFLIFFSLINIFVVHKLIKHVYPLENIPSDFKNDIQGIMKRIYYSIVYTGVLFFSINVKHEKLKYGKWYLLLYLFIIYIVGLICLGYMANFILKN